MSTPIAYMSVLGWVLRQVAAGSRDDPWQATEVWGPVSGR